MSLIWAGRSDELLCTAAGCGKDEYCGECNSCLWHCDCEPSKPTRDPDEYYEEEDR